jgi:hypothetical protein
MVSLLLQRHMLVLVSRSTSFNECRAQRATAFGKPGT